MTRLLAFASVAAIASMVSVAPVNAQQWNDYRYNQRQGWNNDWDNGWRSGWNSRNVSDPSFGNRAGINAARRTGRCVVDLGYGRYEYCGW